MTQSKVLRTGLMMGGFLWLGAAVLAGDASHPSSPAELILYNGTILTMDKAHSTGQAVAITGDQIVGVGTDTEMRALSGKSTRMVDLQGMTVLPGFIDSRVIGPFGYWEALHGVRLTDDAGTPMSSADDIAAAVKAFMDARKADAGQWVVAAGFDPRLDGTRRFTKEWADEMVPNQPFLMLSLDHHIALANTQAIEKLSLKTLAYPEGSGQVDKDPKGEPTGVLREVPVFLAMNGVWNQVPS